MTLYDQVRRTVPRQGLAANATPDNAADYAIASNSAGSDEAVEVLLADLITTLSREVNFSGTLTPAQITASVNNYAPAGYDVVSTLRLAGDAAWNITGLVPPSDAGFFYIVQNVGAFTLTLTDEDAASTAANRFALTANFDLEADAQAIIVYDNTADRWRLVGGGGGGGGTTVFPKTSLEFDTTTTDADPGDFKFRLNNATPANVTFIYVNDEAIGALDISSLLEGRLTDDEITIQQNNDELEAMLFRVTGAPTDGTGYWKIPVALRSVASGGLFTNGENCSFRFERLGSILAAPAKRLRLQLTANQVAGLALNNPVRFDQAVGDYEYDAVNYRVKIPAGEKVELIATIQCAFNASTDFATFRWYDVTAAAYVDGEATIFPQNKATADTSQPMVLTHVLPTVDTEYELRIENLGGTITAITLDRTQAVISYQGQGALTPLASPAIYNTAAGQNINATNTVIDFGTKVQDDDNLVTTGAAWVYTVPNDGYYNLETVVGFPDTTAWTAGWLVRLTLFDDEAGGGLVQTNLLDIWEPLSTAQIPLAWQGDITRFFSAGTQLQVNGAILGGSAKPLSASGTAVYIAIRQAPTRISTAVPPVFKAIVETNTARVLTANVTDVIFEDLIFDPSGMIDLANGRITPPVNSFVVVLGHITGNAAFRPVIFKTTAQLRNGDTQDFANGDSTVSAAEVVDPASDYLTIRSSANITLQNGAPGNYITVLAYPL